MDPAAFMRANDVSSQERTRDEDIDVSFLGTGGKPAAELRAETARSFAFSDARDDATVVGDVSALVRPRFTSPDPSAEDPTSAIDTRGQSLSDVDWDID